MAVKFYRMTPAEKKECYRLGAERHHDARARNAEHRVPDTEIIADLEGYCSEYAFLKLFPDAVKAKEKKDHDNVWQGYRNDVKGKTKPRPIRDSLLFINLSYQTNEVDIFTFIPPIDDDGLVYAWCGWISKNDVFNGGFPRMFEGKKECHAISPGALHTVEPSELLFSR